MGPNNVEAEDGIHDRKNKEKGMCVVLVSRGAIDMLLQQYGSHISRKLERINVI
jgi:hypothetical protein